MPRLRLFHWKRTEAEPVVAKLEAAGFSVDYEEEFLASVRAARAQPPQVVVIDLSRMPSHGRETAIALRNTKTMRKVPQVFVGGALEKVEKLRELMPDAVYTTPENMVAAIRAVLKAGPVELKPTSDMMNRWSERAVWQKLGIAPDGRVKLIDPPPHFEKVIPGIPETVTYLEEEDRGACVVLGFVRDLDGLRRLLGRAKALGKEAKFWIIWPKGSGADGKITQNDVRENSIRVGLVDYKICAVDARWSGMLFAQRKS